MKKIIYTRPDGGLSVFNACEGARLAMGLRDADGNPVAVSEVPLPVDRFLRRWPVDGMTATWAETEDEFIVRVAARSIPADATDVQLVEPEIIPTDRTFRDAWKAGSGKVEYDMAKCKAMAHEKRRERREAEFKPHDDVIAKQIPGKSATGAEAARQAIREKYDAMQAAIDAATSVEEIKAVLA